MPLRLIELAVPVDQADRVGPVLEEATLVDSWSTGGQEGDYASFRILVDANHAEPVMDLLVERVGGRPEFRIVLLAVEATVPAVAEPTPPEPPVNGEKPAAAPRRISREELYEDVAHASRITWLYLVMVALSTVVAAVGLLRGDVAVIVGAMVIAPLLGPNIGLALAATLGDPVLAKRSLRATAAGVTTAAALSLLLGAALTVDPAAPELAARTGAELGDIALALAAGAAGSLAFTSGVPTIVVGVMVAVALLPPLVVAGLFAGSGRWDLALGAGTLVLTNVTCINLAAVVTFLVQNVGPRTWWEAERAKKATRWAVAAWVLMLAVLVVLIALGQVKGGVAG